MMTEKMTELEAMGPDEDITKKLSTLVDVLTEFMSYEALFLDKLRRFIEDYRNYGGISFVNKRYCAIVNGKLCKKYVSVDGTAPERAVRTEFFAHENPGKDVFWLPVHILDPNESDWIELMSDYFLKDNYPKVDGVFVIEDGNVTRVSDDWRKRE